MRYELRGVCAGMFHTNLHPRNTTTTKAQLSVVTRVGQKIDAFELWCWEKTLESPLDCKEIKQSILNEISPEYLLKELMLKLQYSGNLMQRTDSRKDLMLGKTEGRKRRG